MMKRRIIITASVFGALAVIAGAFGAHGLQKLISAHYLEVWDTAVKYQFYHVFALLFLSTITTFKPKMLTAIYWFFTLGIICFSGSLYLLALSDFLGWSWLIWMGPVTPFGGLLFISGWIAMGIAAFKNK